MLKRLELFYIATIFMFIITVVLVLYTMEREQEYKTHQENIQKTVIEGAAYAINLQLRNKQRHVRLFIDEYSTALSHLYHNPRDEITENNLRDRLQQRFTDFFTYTITDLDGEHQLLDIDSRVGDACQLDLDDFGRKIKNNQVDIRNTIFIHPQAFHYHYDIMIPMQVNTLNSMDTRKIFFASFYLNEITDILKTHEVPGQTLMLTRQSDPTLIEVTRIGSRDKLSRNSRLSPEEILNISAHKNIPATDWRLISLQDKSDEQQYISNLWKEVLTILSIVGIALILLIVILIKLTSKHRSNHN